MVAPPLAEVRLEVPAAVEGEVPLLEGLGKGDQVDGEMLRTLSHGLADSSTSSTSVLSMDSRFLWPGREPGRVGERARVTLAVGLHWSLAGWAGEWGLYSACAPSRGCAPVGEGGVGDGLVLTVAINGKNQDIEIYGFIK